MKLNRNQKSRLPQITGHRGAPSILLCVSVASVRNVPPRPRSFSIGAEAPPPSPFIQHSAFRIQHWRRSALALQRQEGLTDDRF